MIQKLFVKLHNEYDENKMLLEENVQYLYLAHPTSSKITYSINFDGGSLLLGINQNHLLNSLELNIPRKWWKLSEINLSKPNPTEKGCIEFPEVTKRHNEFDRSPIVYTNNARSAVLIEIENHQGNDFYWAVISDDCFIKINNNYLTGFWINLSTSVVTI